MKNLNDALRNSTVSLIVSTVSLLFSITVLVLKTKGII